MSISSALKSLTPIIKRGVVIIKAKSPSILIATGIASGIASTIIAVKRHSIAVESNKSFEFDLEAIDKCHESGRIVIQTDSIVSEEEKKYTEAMYRKDLRALYTNKINAYIHAYGPSIALTAVSITCILVSHGLMRQRNAALTAAVASISEAFKRYRGNVRREYGDQVDYNMRHGIITKAEKVKETDPETGKTHTVTKTVRERRDDMPWRSDYARCYDASCRNWTKDANANRLTLIGFQAWANQKLKAQGFLYLNEVYDLLGIEPTLAGHEMGWVYTKEENKYGDNFVDFGFEKTWDFNSGLENCVWLDFNVDELPITDRINLRRI